jgi:trans-2,3-dihydro-3-hydroxyanthranilate isomerase
MQRRYHLLDVFTEQPGSGNGLAVVQDCEGLETAAMQRIAADFGLSETVFALPPVDPLHAARIRIFTPDYEMPFAGHPTVGAAVWLASDSARYPGGAALIVLEEEIGLVRCAVTKGGAASFAEFDIPKLPEPFGAAPASEAVAVALGLGIHEIGFENHEIAAWSAGVPYIMVPVRNLEAAAKLRFDSKLWSDFAPPKGGGAVASAYVYCRDTVNHDSDFHARMFVPGEPSYEDPATGSAAAAFAAQIMRFDEPLDGSHAYAIEQGIEMGRPSLVKLGIDVEDGAIRRARIGGHAVITGSGAIEA